MNTKCKPDIDDESRTWTVNADHDLRVASWHIADLFLGPDDGSIERDATECEIQEILKQNFTDTAGTFSVFGAPAPDDTTFVGPRPRRHERRH